MNKNLMFNRLLIEQDYDIKGFQISLKNFVIMALTYFIVTDVLSSTHSFLLRNGIAVVVLVIEIVVFKKYKGVELYKHTFSLIRFNFHRKMYD